MADQHPRLAREARTVEAMVQIYCRGHHALNEPGLCQECNDLLSYARHKLDLCPFQESKSTCAKCRIHCYQPDRRDQIKAVMRYAGPRMLLKHPALAIHHLLDGRREAPDPKDLGGRRRKSHQNP